MEGPRTDALADPLPYGHLELYCVCRVGSAVDILACSMAYSFVCLSEAVVVVLGTTLSHCDSLLMRLPMVLEKLSLAVVHVAEQIDYNLLVIVGCDD